MTHTDYVEGVDLEYLDPRWPGYSRLAKAPIQPHNRPGYSLVQGDGEIKVEVAKAVETYKEGQIKKAKQAAKEAGKDDNEPKAKKARTSVKSTSNYNILFALPWYLGMARLDFTKSQGLDSDKHIVCPLEARRDDGTIEDCGFEPEGGRAHNLGVLDKHIEKHCKDLDKVPCPLNHSNKVLLFDNKEQLLLHYQNSHPNVSSDWIENPPLKPKVIHWLYCNRLLANHFEKQGLDNEDYIKWFDLDIQRFAGTNADEMLEGDCFGPTRELARLVKSGRFRHIEGYDNKTSAEKEALHRDRVENDSLLKYVISLEDDEEE